jgi:hypothetical protein
MAVRVDAMTCGTLGRDDAGDVSLIQRRCFRRRATCQAGKPRQLAARLSALLIASLALGCATATGRPIGVRLADTASVQFTDNFLLQPGWPQRLDYAKEAGARFVRIDLNWPWIEKQPGEYDWALYDEFAAALRARRLRPIFILHRANALYSAMPQPARGTPDDLPPVTPEAIAAFSAWAAAAATRYRDLDAIWEIWNEPDMAMFWPPAPHPQQYVALARATCRAIKRQVPDAFVVGPAAAQVPTVWRTRKSLFAALEDDGALLACLDAVSVHTHRFGQAPETVERDYHVMRRTYPRVSAKPIIDTEWGDAVSTGGISEAQQAAWLTRMYLINAMQRIGLTNWYCLVDVGSDAADREHRFGLVTEDGRRRPAFAAYRTLVDELGGMALRETLRRFDADDASSATVLLFCDDAERCKLAAWTTEDVGTAEIAVDGWRADGPARDLFGQPIAGPDPTPSPLRLRLTPQVQYVTVTPAS